MAAVDFGDVRTSEGMVRLNEHMKCHSYVTGFAPSQQDVTIYALVPGEPCREEYPFAARWWRHVASFGLSERCRWPGQKSVPREKPLAAKKAAKDDDDDFDLFGEETAEEKKASEALKARTASTADAKKKVKKPVIEKSSLVIDVKPAGLHVNLDDLEKLIREINMEGLEWAKAAKKVPLVFGLFKLQVGCNIVDSLINTDDILATIECLGLDEEKTKAKLARREIGDDEEDDDDDDEEGSGLVASAQIVSFQKL